MKVKQFLQNMEALKKQCEQFPSLLEAEVITSKDDEGNGYNHVYYSPSTGHFDGVDYDTAPAGDAKVNAVCLN